MRLFKASKKWYGKAVWMLIILTCGLMLTEVVRVGVGNNFHELIPGRVYRCAQLSGEQLERVCEKWGIQTIINLRGSCPTMSWYLEECAATNRQEVQQFDVGLSAGRVPSVHEMRRLVEVLERAPYPILIHCRRGSDRTGLVAALILLLQTDVSLPQARRQLGMRYAHLPVGRPLYLDSFLDLYGEWLAEQGRQHTPGALRRWLVSEYRPAECWCTLELVPPASTIRAGEPSLLRLRALNTSVRPWQLKPGLTAGIHAYFLLWDEEDGLVATARAGLLDARVEIGETFEFSIALPAVKKPGRYRLWLDLVSEQHCEFYKTGSEPLEVELVIR